LQTSMEKVLLAKGKADTADYEYDLLEKELEEL
jgi:hypothetical protein